MRIRLVFYCIWLYYYFSASNGECGVSSSAQISFKIGQHVWASSDSKMYARVSYWYDYGDGRGDIWGSRETVTPWFPLDNCWCDDFEENSITYIPQIIYSSIGHQFKYIDDIQLYNCGSDGVQIKEITFNIPEYYGGSWEKTLNSFEKWPSHNEQEQCFKDNTFWVDGYVNHLGGPQGEECKLITIWVGHDVSKTVGYGGWNNIVSAEGTTAPCDKCWNQDGTQSAQSPAFLSKLTDDYRESSPDNKNNQYDLTKYVIISQNQFIIGVSLLLLVVIITLINIKCIARKVNKNNEKMVDTF